MINVINFTLYNLDDIPTFGEHPDVSLHWFGLTYGELHLKFGDTRIYEYTENVLEYWGDTKPVKYVDYQISRFIEDFSYLFNIISEDVPEQIYDLTDNLHSFLNDTQTLLDIDSESHDGDSDFFDEFYKPLTQWIGRRSVAATHLIGGPVLYFFKNGQQMRVVWETQQKLNNGVDIWTASSGYLDMKYSEFIGEINNFAVLFFEAMGEQVQQAIDKDWGAGELDKKRLAEEHKERREGFFDMFKHLENPTSGKTDWQEIHTLFDRMKTELGILNSQP